MGKNALIIIDAQNDFVTGVLGTPEAQKAVPKIVELLKKANANGDQVIFTKDIHLNEDIYLKSQEGVRLPIFHCGDGTKGAEIVDELREETYGDDTKIIEKSRFGYIGWGMESVHLCYCDKITICGFCTDVCVISNALMLKALWPCVEFEVVADACAGTTPEMHQKALDVMKSCQIDIV